MQDEKKTIRVVLEFRCSSPADLEIFQNVLEVLKELFKAGKVKLSSK